MKQNVLYISYDGMTDPLGQSQVLPYIVGLSKNYQFHLISFEKPKVYEKNKTVIEAICKENNIVWHPLEYTKNPPVLSTLIDVYKMKKLTKKLDKEFDFKTIHCRSYISSLVGLYMKQNHQKKFVFDMRGFWADERVEGGIWNLKNPIYKIIYNYFKKKERAYLQHSDAIISLTENGKNEILSWNVPTVDDAKIMVIPCATDFNLFEVNTVDKKREAKKKLGLDEQQKVISYLGSLGTWYLLDEMLKFFSYFKKVYTDSKFLILTKEPKELVYQKLTKYSLKKEDFIIQFAQRKDIPSYIHSSDISLIFIKPSYSKKSSSPTKMGELLAMGVPIICNENVGDSNEIMNSINVGYSLPNFEEKEIIKCIDSLDGVFKISSDEIREQAKSIFLLETNIEKYQTIYKRLNE